MRVAFWGTDGVFSHAALSGLLAADVHVDAVFVYDRAARPVAPAPPPAASDDDIPLLTSFVQRSTTTLAWQRAIPVWRVGDVRHAATAQILAAQQADVACVACFPRLLPPSLLAVPRHGFLNMHPSLLPAYRGPAPLFWQLRDGVAKTGVTIHWMDASFDTGALAAQAPVTLPNGAGGPRSRHAHGRGRRSGAGPGAHTVGTGRCAAHAATSRRQLPTLAQGGRLCAGPRMDGAACVQLYARHGRWGMPYPLQVNGARWSLRKALRVEPTGVETVAA
ncbi:MAG: formyltransferase family protein [Caldilineaceae bacterium]